MATTTIDDKLVKAGARGDPRSREDLARACVPFVWRIVYLSCGNSIDVEDLVQSALAKAFEDLQGYSGQGSFKAWLRTVTVNVVRQHFRRRSVRMLVPFSHKLDLLASKNQPSPEASTEAELFYSKLAVLLSKIKPKNRVALLLSLTEGLSSAEIALSVGCNVETAKKRLLRGRRDLVAKIQKDPYMSKLVEELGL